jgi:SAM-dependent methyltransferase
MKLKKRLRRARDRLPQGLRWPRLNLAPLTVRMRLLTRNLAYRLAGAEDGFALPPDRLLKLVSNDNTLAWHLIGGEKAALIVKETLIHNGLELEQFEKVLDFGCGIGRTIRHFSKVEGPQFFATDYNAEAIGWCRKALGRIAEFRVNRLSPPLEYQAESFDLIYALSVFTHLDEPRQKPWMAELRRVLRPGGYLIVTTHGRAYQHHLPEPKLKAFRRGKFVAISPDRAGTNICAAFHPHDYMVEQLCDGFDMVDYLPYRYLGQDVYLLRRPPKN